MPSPVRRPFVLWVNAKMGGYEPVENPDLPQRLRRNRASRQRSEAKKRASGLRLLVLTSHPDTEGPHQWLRFELLRQGLKVAGCRRGSCKSKGAWYPAHPRCFLAIDPYALDTVSGAVGGFYSAWMHRIYIAWDRQPSTQSWFQRHVLLRDSGYPRIAWRLLKYLREDTPILMALGGGLPYNARLLYTAREFVQRLPVDHWMIPKRVARIELMEILMKPQGDIWPAEKGEFPTATQDAVRQAMKTWGLGSEKIEPALRELIEEFKHPVPYRVRLFRVLMNRLVARGKPVLFVSIAHSDAAPHVRLGLPVGVSAVPKDVGAFARDFVHRNFGP